MPCFNSYHSISNTNIPSGLQARNLETRLNEKLAGAGRSISSGDRFLVMTSKGKYVDASLYQPGQAYQLNRNTPDVDTKRTLQAEAVGYDGENISFRDVTQDVLAQKKMESGAAIGENVVEVAGDGEGGYNDFELAPNDVAGKIYTPAEYKGTVKVNGEVRDVSRRVYQRNDIDIDYVDETTGLTNLELMMKLGMMAIRLNYITYCN